MLNILWYTSRNWGDSLSSATMCNITRSSANAEGPRHALF